MAECRTLIAENQALFRVALRHLLQAQRGFEIVADTGCGSQALELAREHRPDLIIIDVGLAEISGIELLRRTSDLSLRALLLAGAEHAHLAGEALHAGAGGYLLKTCQADEFLAACRTVARGNVYLGGHLGPQAGAMMVNGNGSLPACPLTARERQVLQLLAEGHPSKAIAAQLNISARTIETHRYQIMGKVKLRSVAALTKYAIRHGLTSL